MRLTQSWRLEQCCQTGLTQEWSQRNMTKKQGCAERVVAVRAVIGRAGSSWERLAGAVYGFHPDGLFPMPPSPNADTDPLERGVQLGKDKRGRGLRRCMLCELTNTFKGCVHWPTAVVALWHAHANAFLRKIARQHCQWRWRPSRNVDISSHLFRQIWHYYTTTSTLT